MDRPIDFGGGEEDAGGTRGLQILGGLALVVSLAVVQSSSGATANARIAFITTRDVSEIYTIEADGTGEAPLTRRDPAGSAPAWSPDGSTIAFTGWGTSFANLWVMGRDGSDVRTLGDFRTDSGPGPDADWSPNGGRLVFSQYYDVFTVRRDGTGLKRISGRGTYDEWDPSWSPAGGAIAFTGDGRIYRMRPDGSRKQRLGVGDHADWSPNGKRIVFVRWQPNGRGDIYVMNADGSNVKRLMQTRRLNESRPAWSPGGGKIAFQRGRSFRRSSMWLMDPDGSDAHRIAFNASTPAWSPGGAFLLFSRSRTIQHAGDAERASAIFSMRRDGSAKTRLLNPAFDREVAASPDGTKIAFVSIRPFAQSGVYVAHADGTNEAFVHTGWSPAWSPDSAQLVFQDVDGLYLTDDGSTPVKLPAPLDSGGQPLREVREPGWRPDGAAVTFVAVEAPDGCSEVYTMAPDGSAVTQVTAADCAPQVGGYDWAADAGSIVLAGSTCDADFNCTDQIFIATPPSGVPSALTHPDPDFAQDVEPAIAPDGTKIAFRRFDFHALIEWDVWVMDADGTDETKVTTTGDNGAPAWQTLP
jgi:Tol biopolymer transport system component